MCFSAGASFGASAIVAVAGVVSIKKIKTKRQIMFASIPILFSMQQLSEGFVWLTFTHREYLQWQNIPVMIFLFLAQVLWPVWVPLSMLLVEKEGRRRIALKILACVSLVLAPLQAYRLFFYPFDAQPTLNHIHYSLDFSIPHYGFILNIFYFLATIVPPFLATSKRIRMLGILNLASFIVTVIFFGKDVISVWCFFAAFLSLMVILAMNELNGKSENGAVSLH